MVVCLPCNHFGVLFKTLKGFVKTQFRIQAAREFKLLWKMRAPELVKIRTHL